MNTIWVLQRFRWLGAWVLCVASVAYAGKSRFSEFLIFDDNAIGMVELSSVHPELFLALPESDLNASFDFLFLKFQRENARAWVKNLYRASNCRVARKDAVRFKLCSYLESLWAGPLLESFFWDASVVQLSRARELLVGPYKSPRIQRDQCGEAAGLVAEVEAKEGLMGPLAETQLKVFECVGDEAGRLDVYQKLETLRNIQSALGT